MSVGSLLVLYLLFRVKHLICDFFLQTDWMALNKSNPGTDGLSALLTHAGIHAVGTLVIIMLFAPGFWWLAIVDFVVHGGIDRIKGVVTKKMGWNPKDTYFWWALGVDQEAHNLTHLAYIVLIVIAKGGLML